MVDISDLTPFEQAALRATAQIPPGEVRSYAWVATQIGHPRAARAVGRVMARNPLPLLFPCHRVVDSSGALHDYFYGLDMKARLLEMEGYRGVSVPEGNATAAPTLASVAILVHFGATHKGRVSLSDPRIAAIPDVHGHAKGEHRPFAEERPDRVFSADAFPVVLPCLPARSRRAS